MSFLSKLFVGGTSGVLATSIVYPLDIVKTAMQVWLTAICLALETSGRAKYEVQEPFSSF